MTHEILILAVTKMLSGVCTAGFAQERDAATGLRWVRPVKAHDTLLLGDLADAAGRVVQPFDVVELALEKERPEPPHVEDWVTDFVRHRPRVVRRIEGKRRADLLAECVDRSPQQVLVDHSRSLCLVQPDTVQIRFSRDSYSGKFDARLSFALNSTQYGSQKRLPVTDLKWRALGYSWLGDSGGAVEMDDAELRDSLGLEALYLVLGLSRSYQGQWWTLVVGVHTVPDFEVEIDYARM